MMTTLNAGLMAVAAAENGEVGLVSLDGAADGVKHPTPARAVGCARLPP